MLSRRPGHVAAAEQVEVKMVDGLAAVLTGVDDDTIALVEPVHACELGCGREQMAEKRGLFRRGLGLRGDVLLGDDEQVGPSLRLDVRKPDAEFVFVHTVRRDLSIQDLAKQTVRNRSTNNIVL